MDGSSRPRAPQPPSPDRGFSFTDWQTSNPTAPPPGDKLDAEFDRTNQAVEDVINWVSTSLNSDGSLVEPSVGEPPPETGAVALAEDWAEVSVAWAEHMPDTIPPNILATNAITGDHWSSRWWANRAAQIVQGQIKVPVWLPEGQPDGVTDNSEALQAALDAAAGCSDPAGEDPLGGVDNTMRAAAPGQWTLVIPAAPAPYIIGSSLYIPSNTHLVIAHGATLKLAPQTNANMFLLCNFAHHVLIELYGTLDGNSSQQYFQLNLDYPATNGNPASISGGISNDRIWGGPARNPPVQGGFCSHVKIIGDRNGLITNFQNQAVGLSGATNCEVSDISLTNSAFHAGSVGVSGWRNFPYDPAAGTPLTFTGTFVAASGIVTLTTNVPHCMVPGEEFITEQLTGTGGFNAATGKLFITLAGTAGNTIVYAATGGGVGTDGSITGGRITNWFYQQATIASGTYVPATGIITVTTTAPHQLVYGQTISSNVTGGTAAAIATGIFQLLDVTDGAGAPPITAAKNVTLRYRTARTGTTENIVSGVYDAPSGTVTLTTDAPHGLSPGDVVTVAATGSGFLSGLHGEYVCVAGTTGTTIKYVGPPNLAGITISGGTVYGGPTLSIMGGTIGVSTKCWNSGFDNCFIDQIRDIGPCIYGGGVNCYIRNSEVTRNLGSGPYLFSDVNSGRCVDCEISDNYIHDNYGAGIGTANFGPGSPPHIGTRVFGNRVTGNRGGAEFGSCDGLECADNRFYKNRAEGLNTYGSVGEITLDPSANRVSVTGNTIRDPCVISTTMAGTTLTQVVSGTYNNATGAVSLTTAIPHNLFNNAYFTLSATVGTGAHASIEGRYIAEASTDPTILNFHAPAGLGSITITGGQLVPNGFGIVVHGATNLSITDNFIGDYQTTRTMLAAIGGTWGTGGVCTGNYYGPRINTGGNFPADMSAGGIRGNNFDVVTGFTDGTTLRQPFSSDVNERFAPLGIQVGYNRSGGRGESNIYVGAGNGAPGGFDFIKITGISLTSPGGYDSTTAIVTLTTKNPHGLVVGSRFNLSLVLGTDSVGFTDGRDIQKLGGNWIATADNAGTSGITINFVLTQNVAGVPTPYTGLDILTITGGAINASALDSGVIDTSVGLPVVVSNSGTLGFTTGGSLLSVDGYANTRLSGALVHGAIQTATLVNGGTVTVPQNTSFMLVNNSSSIATGSLVLPAPAASSYQTIGSQLDVRFQNSVGSLTVTAATGAAVAGPPTTVLSAGASFRFIQGGPGAAANTWLPCIPDVSGTPPVGGPYLPTSGGAVTGPLTVNGLLTATAGITGSGINSTPIGATTPSTGAFTNLSATGTVTLPAGTTGPFLPLATGGTVAGVTSFSAAGQALRVTNNALISGALTISGAGTGLTVAGATSVGGNQTFTQAGTAQVNLAYQGNGKTTWSMNRDAVSSTTYNSSMGLGLGAYDDNTGGFLSYLWHGKRASGPTGQGGPYFDIMSPYDMQGARAAIPGGTYGNKISLTPADVQPTTTLGANPLSTTSGSAVVAVTWTGCGSASGVFQAGADVWVNLLGVTATGGITPTGWLHGTRIDNDHFSITWTSNATSTATGGGAAVTVQPSWAASVEQFSVTMTSGGAGFPMGQMLLYEANPAFYQPLSTGTGPQYQQQWRQFIGPNDPSPVGTNRWGAVATEMDLFNRSYDIGYAPDVTTAGNPTIGFWVGPVRTVPSWAVGGGTSKNWNTVYTVKGNFGAVASYTGFSVQGNALVGATIDPTGHGGVGFVTFGSYTYVRGSDISSTSGTNKITFNVGAANLLAQVNGNSVYVPTAATLNGVAYGGGSYVISNVTASTFDITGTGTASASGPSGIPQTIMFANLVPYAPVEFQGSFKHGISTTNFRSEDGSIIRTQPGNGIVWDNGTGGVASITGTSISSGATVLSLGTMPINAANDAAAATALVPVGGIYRNGSVLMVRTV